MSLQLRPYQQQIVDSICYKPATAVWALMGAGKTAATLEAIRRLLGACIVSKVLLIAPKRVALHTWPAERKKWSSFHNISMAVCSGQAQTRIRALERGCQVTIVSRDLVVWLYEAYFGSPAKAKKIKIKPELHAFTLLARKLMLWFNNLQGFYACTLLLYLQWSGGHYVQPAQPPIMDILWPYDMVVVDESTSFKDASSQRWKELAKIMPNVSKRVTLTGTPAPNSIAEQWAQYYLLDAGKRLGATYKQFEQTYFDSGYNKWDKSIKLGADEQLQRAIADITIVVKSYEGLPEISYINNYIDLDDTSLELYKELEKEYLIKHADAFISAGSAGILAGKLLQIAGGAVYSDVDELSRRRDVVPVHNAKIEALQEILEGCPGENVIVCYNYQHELERLLKAFPQAVKLKSNESLDNWNAGKIPIGLAHPASLGHGLNLQHGGRRLIWYSPTWSNELKQQMDTRLYRSGQSEHVFVHTLVANGTIDEVVIAKLAARQDCQQAIIEMVAKLKQALLN